MWRERLAAWWRGRAESLRLPALSAVRRRVAVAWHAGRRRPEAVLAAVVVLGVAVMILHWS
jgi:hypothetical protein